MKTLLILLLIFSTSIIARENPFSPTNAYEEEAARMIEINETEEDYDVEFQQEQQYVNNIYEKMNNPNEEKVDSTKADKTKLTEEKVQKMIKEAQKKSAPKVIIKKIIEKPVEPQQVVYVKPRIDVVAQRELLPFVKLEYDNEKIDIYSKYKVTKKITLPNKKKIVLDYNAKEDFYTIREDLKSTNFPKIAVGNHKKDKFFRVVVELADIPENYEVTYDNNKVTIVKLYE